LLKGRLKKASFLFRKSMKFVTHNATFQLKEHLTGAALEVKQKVESLMASTPISGHPYAPKGRLGFMVDDRVVDLELAVHKYAMQHDKVTTDRFPNDIISFNGR
jgi:hypothetical protein